MGNITDLYFKLIEWDVRENIFFFFFFAMSNLTDSLARRPQLFISLLYER